MAHTIRNRLLISKQTGKKYSRGVKVFKIVRNTVQLAPETQPLKPGVIISRVGWAVFTQYTHGPQRLWLASLDFPQCNIPTMGQEVCVHLSWGLYCCGRTQQQHEEERIHISLQISGNSLPLRKARAGTQAGQEPEEGRNLEARSSWFAHSALLYHPGPHSQG